MTYEEIFVTLKKRMGNALPELDVDQINPQDSLSTYGANSVLIVDVISRLIRELKIEAPGPELIATKNIDELIKVLLKYSNLQQNK